MTRLPVRLDGDTLLIGDRFTASFQRTLRVPDDGRDYPLPPGLGPLPLVPAEQCGDRLPPFMRGRATFLLPMHQREALWLAFGGAYWKPNAVKVGVDQSGHAMIHILNSRQFREVTGQSRPPRPSAPASTPSTAFRGSRCSTRTRKPSPPPTSSSG